MTTVHEGLQAECAERDRTYMIRASACGRVFVRFRKRSTVAYSKSKGYARDYVESNLDAPIYDSINWAERPAEIQACYASEVSCGSTLYSMVRA